MRRGILAFLVSGFALAASCRHAEASIVERIVAVVGERPVLLSELRHRARPNLLLMYATTPNPAQQSVEENRIYREVLEHMIDEQLVEQAAQKAHLVVSVDDIDKAIAKKAGEMGIDPKALIAEARREGLSEQDYRDEIRRQILEGKLVQLRVAGRVHITETDARNVYQQWAQQLSQQKPMQMRILAMAIPQGASQQKISELETLAQNIVQDVRNGADFCGFVAQHSAVPNAAQTCGERIAPFVSLPPVVQDQLSGLKDGEVSNPIRFGTNEIDIIQKVRMIPLQPFEQVRDKMMEAAANEAFMHQRDLYLKELRRGVYVEVRLNS
jgi:peptidyl-prolyl cis-trans isomerase SurA